MIHIIPSISVIKGKTIRLTKGDYDNEKEYKTAPIDVAKQMEDIGVKAIHIVDLEGARKGSSVNYNTLSEIAGYTDLYINFSGGIQTDGDINKAFEYGATSITAATIAYRNKELFASWIMSYGQEKIALGADALDGKIAIRGWQKGTGADIFEHIEYFYNRNLKYLKTTDIAKDGSLEGPSLHLYEEIIKRFPDLRLFASGGVRSVDDIKKLEDLGVYGVIFGKALYEGKIKPEELTQFLV